jgi:phage terminase small subunit
MRAIKIKPKSTKTPMYKLYEGLNPQQMQFIEAMMADKAMNMLSAAKQAGYKNPSSAVQKLQQNKGVMKALNNALYQRMMVMGLTKERVIYELMAIGFISPQDFVDENGNYLALQDLPDHVARAIKTIKISHKVDEEDTTEIVEFELWNKLDALKLLAAHTGMTLNPDVNINVGAGFNFDALWQAANEGSNEDLVEQRLIEESKKQTRVEPEIIETSYDIVEDFNEQGDE